ncbi:MAG: hypothetical protein IPF98_22650 [Gemmatimonadetes bacterium]|nr:hypothetical protein [Gemmatimonadota bacterium]
MSLDAEGILVGRLAVRWPRARVAAREPECVLEPLDTASNREFAAGDTLRVVTNGRAWRFVISDEGRVDGRRGIRVSFVRRPRPRLALNSPRSVCGAGVACAIVTTRNPPPPVAQLFLGDVGLDTARYGLLGRLEQGADSARLVQRSGATVLRYNQLTSVAAERLHGQVDAGYLLRVGRVNVGSVVDLVLPIVALVVLWIGTGWALLRIDVFRDLLIAQTARARLAWSLLSAITILGSLRLALGLRSALAEPYNERGEATAIGLWIALPLTLLVLVGTVALWPRLVERIERLAIGGNHGAEPAPRMEARPSTERRRVTLDLGTFLILLALALLAWRERDALQGAAVVVASVLLTWIGFGLSRPSESRRLRRADPLSTLLVPPPESAQLRGLLHTALFVILISLAFYRKALALLITIGAVLTVVVLAALIVRTWRRPGSRDAATTFARMRGVESALMLAVLSGVSLLVGGPFSLFAAVFVLYLLAARVGMIHGWRRLALSRWPVDTTGTPASSSGEHGQGTALAGRAWRRIVTAGVRRHMLDAFVLLLPFICLVPVAILDFGLGLICLVPLLATVLLAADVTRFSRPLQLFALGFVMAVMAAVRPVLFPDTRALHEADTFLARDSAFHHIGGASGQAARLLGAEGAFARATVRSIAARDPEALEKVLVAARPSVARDEILRSIEQAWGGRVYAASGWGGEGLARAPLEGRGISRPTALAENVFATFIASEHGLLGVLGVLSVYLYIVVVVFAWFLATSAEESAAGLSSARQALVLGGTLWLTVPTAYVAMGNLGVVPLTGQNIPFLGLNSWSDVLFCVAICSTLLLAILFGEREGEP